MTERESQTLRFILECVGAGRIRVSSHALQEADEDRISLDQIEAATLRAECIEDFPLDPRGPSCLVLCNLADGRRIHVLWGFDEPSQQAILITVYLPDAQRWSEDLRTRRARDDSEAE